MRRKRREDVWRPIGTGKIKAHRAMRVSTPTICRDRQDRQKECRDHPARADLQMVCRDRVDRAAAVAQAARAREAPAQAALVAREEAAADQAERARSGLQFRVHHMVHPFFLFIVRYEGLRSQHRRRMSCLARAHSTCRARRSRREMTHIRG